jgi:hypothetical protein
MQKLEGVTCCVLVAWQRWLPALPRWFHWLDRKDMLEVFYADHEGSVEAMVESLRTYLGGGAVMTIPKNVREIIVDLEGDILEAGSLAAILHEGFPSATRSVMMTT